MRLIGPLLAALFLGPASGAESASAWKVKSVRTGEAKAGRVEWLHSRDLVAYDQKGEDGLFDLYVRKGDGSASRCLTCGKKDITQRHVGQPAWHPSGEGIVFQVENEHSWSTLNEEPSLGINNDLYYITADGKRYWRLVDNKRGFGALHPKFSHDGKKLLWAERYARGRRASRWGKWRLKLADFSMGKKGPRLENAVEIQPKGPRWYESHGFSPDDKKIYFSGNLRNGWGNDIFVYDLETEDLKCLTTDKEVWDEMAELSPDGKTIAFISSRFFKWKKRLGFLTLRTEIYLMNLDGSGVRRVTRLNERDRDLVIGDLTWSPDGKRLLAVAFNWKTKKPVRVEVEFVK